jgi:hypothetical protein
VVEMKDIVFNKLGCDGLCALTGNNLSHRERDITGLCRSNSYIKNSTVFVWVIILGHQDWTTHVLIRVGMLKG